MIVRVGAAFALCVTLMLSACATAPSLLPAGTELQTYPSTFWDRLDEPTLWRPEDAGAYTSRIRLLLARPTIHDNRFAVRIDRDASGGATILVTRDERRSADEWVTLKRHAFPARAADLAKLDALIAQSRLWQISPEHWANSDGSTICIDGVQIVFERIDASGYRLSEANAQCTAPPDVLAVAEQLVRMSGEIGVTDWLH